MYCMASIVTPGVLPLLAGKRTPRRLIPAVIQFRYPCRSGPQLC
jgi:hypothetical protein